MSYPSRYNKRFTVPVFHCHLAYLEGMLLVNVLPEFFMQKINEDEKQMTNLSRYCGVCYF